MPFEPTFGDIILVGQLVGKAIENYKNAPKDIRRQKEQVAHCIAEIQRHEFEDEDQQKNVFNALKTLELIQTELEKLESCGTGALSRMKRFARRVQHEPSNLDPLWGQLERIDLALILSYCRRLEAAEKGKRLRRHFKSISPYGQVIRNDALDGTYRWVFDLNEIETWAKGTQRILLFYGHPGAGKSTLLSYIADTIKRSTSKSDPKAGVAYIRPGNGSPQLESVDDFLRAILRQLSEQECSGFLLQDKASKKDPDSWPLPQTLLNIRQCAKRMSRVFLFIDAIDELTTVLGPEFLSTLLQCQEQCNAYMILTSTSVDSRLEGHLTIEFKAHDEDISKYVESKIPNLRAGLLQHPNASLPIEVFNDIICISDGVFLIAELIMREAQQHYSIGQLKNTISEIRNITAGGKSSVLPVLYDYVMKKIEGQSASLCSQAKNVMFWVLCSARELSSEEVCSLFELSVGHNSGGSRCGSVPIQDVIYPCRGLITLIPGSLTGHLVDFSHRTVRDYCNEKIDDVPDRHAAIAQTLLGVLINCDYGNGIYDYAVSYWYYHYRLAKPSQPLEHAVVALLQCDLSLEHPKNGFSPFSEVLYPVRATASGELRTFSGIHLAAEFGLHQYLPRLPWTKLDLNSEDSSGVTPLMRAAGNNHSEVVEWLLREGAEIEACDFFLKSAVHHAVVGKCRQTLALLLQHGLQTMKADKKNLTPMHHVARDFKEGLDMLLSAGFSVNTTVTRPQYPAVQTDGDSTPELVPDDADATSECDHPPVGLTPLHYVALLGNQCMVERLLQKGADPSILSPDGESALHVAIAHDLQTGNSPVYGPWDAWNDVESRIESMLDFCLTKGGEEADELYAKEVVHIRETRAAIIKAILSHPGTNVNAQERVRGSSALHLKGDPKWTALLLEFGADPSLRDHQGRTPLHLACLDDTHERAELMVKYGANVFGTDAKARNALHYAAHGKSSDTLKVILDAARGNENPITQSRDSHGRTPLHHVAKKSELRGSESSHAASLLLSHGADVDSMDNNGATPLATLLSTTFIFTNEDLLESLLTGGASATHKSAGGKGLGHLYASTCYQMNVAVLEGLARAGLDLAATDDNGRTILHDCTFSGSLSVETLRYLADVGVEVSLKDNSGHTALDCAREQARKTHPEYTFSCYRWRRTEALLSCWDSGEDVSWLENVRLGECHPELHTPEPLYFESNKMELGIEWD